ncbi:hypothetical protein M8C13_41235 [Crossiella sp. SN42]|uniref:hypothetical protein n=1 Tax=Crossiella sp. SN42 TaxID=2944808 RepID=UPI00207D14F5|nr:hypothetical protein [Crossiella sp. SN42]MCO1582191.1 hypothetical protein [Crossiella sp. SN42]
MGEESQPGRKKREPAITVAILTTAGALLGTIITTGGGLLTGLLKPGGETVRTETVTVHPAPAGVVNGELSLLELEPLSSGPFAKEPAKVSGQVVGEALSQNYVQSGVVYVQHYQAPADYRGFHAQLAVDDRSDHEGPVLFELLDEAGKPVTGKRVAKGKTEEITAPVAPGKKFSLHVSAQTGGAQVAWLRPVLRR